MQQFFLFVIFLYASVGLLIIIGDSVKKKNIKFTTHELVSVFYRTAAYGTVMLIATYIYYLLGIKPE